MLLSYVGLQRPPGGGPATCVADPYYSCGPTNDPYWANVVLMLHGDGTNGSTTATDSSTSARASTRFGSAELSTAEKKWGTASIYQPTNSSYFSYPFALSFAAGEPLTVELWFYNTRTSGVCNLFATNYLGVEFACFVTCSASTFDVNARLGGVNTSTVGGGIPNNTWVHLAFVRDGTTAGIYVNGVRRTTDSGAGSAFSPSTFTVGWAELSFGYGTGVTGYIDDFRITKGIARYTGNFNIPTAAFPDAQSTNTPADPHWASVQLLLRFDGFDGSRVFPDSSSANRTVSESGSTGLTTSVKKFGSAAFTTSTGDFIVSVPDAPSLQVGSGPFTFEAWHRTGAAPGGTLSKQFEWEIGFENVSLYRRIRVRMGSNGSTYSHDQYFPASGNGYALATWFHLAVVRNGDTVTVYIDGVSQGSMTFTGSVADTANDLRLGKVPSGPFMLAGAGLDEVRFTVGVARYTGNFTPPAAQFPPGVASWVDPARTVLSLHADDLLDASCAQPKTVTLTGTASISTAEEKFGTSSFFINGVWPAVAIDGVVIADHQDFDFGTGDFTVDFWARKTPSFGNEQLFNFTLAAGTWNAYVLSNGNLQVSWRSSVGGIDSSQVAFPMGAWNHVVMSRLGANFLLFLNGALASTSAVPGGAAATVNSTQPLYLGRGAGENYCWNGYIDEFRVTKGAARYTGAFTPPTLLNCDSTTGGSGGDTTPIAAPAPPLPPQPPAPQPLAFAASTVATLSGVVGTPIGSTTLAAITCADTAMTISLSETVPGLTFAYSSNTLTVSGTPTAPGQARRVVVSYIASDGTSQIRGSTSHNVNIADPAVPLVIGANASYSGRVGVPVDLTLCTMTLAANDLVRISYNLPVAGMTPTLVWTQGTSSSGALKLVGTPTAPLVFSALTVSYYNSRGDLIGSSVHYTQVAPAYSATPAPPAPAPAPAPPSPSPAPTPSPAPAPGLGPDPFIGPSSILHRFETKTDDPILPVFVAERGPNFLGYIRQTAGAAGFGLRVNASEPYQEGFPASGPGGGGVFVGAEFGNSINVDGTDGNLCAECMVDIDAACWAAMTAPGADQRVCAILTYASGPSSIVSSAPTIWTLALVRSAGVVFPVFWRRVINGNGAYSVRMATLTWRPGRFVHLAFNTEASGAVASTAAWFDGAVAAGADIALSALTAAPQGIVSVGGAIEAPEWIAGTERYSTLVPFSGVVDELRITTASRYAAYTTPAIDLPAAARVIPWPNY